MHLLPSTDGTFKTHKPGGILVLNSSGSLVSTIQASARNAINAPWDMTVFEQGTRPWPLSRTLRTPTTRAMSVASTSRCRAPASLSSAARKSRRDTSRSPMRWGSSPDRPGLVYDPATDILYVASTLDNAVYAVTSASTRTTSGGKGTKIFSDNTVLFGPLGMAQAPNGDLIVANSDLTSNAVLTQPSEYVEFYQDRQLRRPVQYRRQSGRCLRPRGRRHRRRAPRLAVVTTTCRT